MLHDFTARALAAQNRGSVRMLSATSMLSRHARVVVAGDSITSASSGRPNHAANQWWGRGYATLAIWQSGLRGVINAGVSGNTSTQLLARWQSDVLAFKPDAVLLMIGTNDVLASGFNDTKLATLMSNIEQMVLQSLVANVLPIVVTPPAKDGNKAGTRQIIPFYYRLAEAYDLPLIDMFAVTVDPITGGWKSGLSDDGTHPSAAEERLMATHAAATLSNLSTYRAKPYLAAYSETTASNPANLIRNGSFAQQATSGVPDGWWINTTGASNDVTQNAPAPFTGKEFIHHKTEEGQVFYPLQAPAMTGLTAGDRIRFTGNLKVEDLGEHTAGYSLALEASQRGVRPFYNIKDQEGDFTFDVEMVVEEGYTGISPYFLCGATGTYRIRNLTAINLTAMDSIWKPANGR